MHALNALFAPHISFIVILSLEFLFTIEYKMWRASCLCLHEKMYEICIAPIAASSEIKKNQQQFVWLARLYHMGSISEFGTL